MGVPARILSLGNISLVGVDERDYAEAIVVSSRYNVSMNNAVAYIKMRENGVKEIYTFGKHFKNLSGITIVQE